VVLQPLGKLFCVSQTVTFDGFVLGRVNDLGWNSIPHHDAHRNRNLGGGTAAIAKGYGVGVFERVLLPHCPAKLFSAARPSRWKAERP